MELEGLIELLSINSYTTNRDGVNAKHDLIQRMLDGLPLSWERMPHETFGDFMVARSDSMQDDKPVIALVMHTDTVYLPTQQFPIREKANTLHGPGVADMQGSIFVVLETVKQLAAGDRLQNLILVFNPCEEKGSPAFQEEFKKIASEVTHALVFEKADDGDVTDSDPDFLTTFELASARKGIFQQKIAVTGPGGHSGVLTAKADRKNAISQAIKMMQAIDDLADYQAGTTVNLAFVEGGKENTVLAEDCRFVFDIRYKTAAEEQRVKSAISELLSAATLPGINITDQGYNYNLPSWEYSANSKSFFEQVRNSGHKHGLLVVNSERGGWSDACNLYTYNPNLFILDGFGPKGNFEHSLKEFVYLPTIESCIKLTHQVITDLQS